MLSKTLENSLLYVPFLILPNLCSTEYFKKNIEYEINVVYTGCAKKKDILNIHIKSEGIKIFLQKFGYIEFTIFVVKCQKFTYIAQLFIR